MPGKNVVRELGKRYAEIAADSRQKKTIDEWRALNGLKPIRPMVRIEQLPWAELDWGADKMVNEDGLLARIERGMRMTIYQWENFKADMVVLPEITVSKTVRNAGVGPQACVERMGLSQHYEAQLATIEEVERLQTPTIEVDPEQDQRNLALLSEVLDGILPVRLCGHIRHSGLWDLISTKISPERMLYDLIDRPDYVRALIGKFVEMEQGVLDQFEAHGLLEPANADIHCTGGFCDELPSKDYDGVNATAKDCWAFSMGQMFSEVSPAMQEEFEIIPMKPLLERYGLLYYGCCEPLHHKIDNVRKLKNVRKVSISPWANKEVAAANIHGDYVFSSKPNPAHVAMGSFNADLVRNELTEIVEICKRHDTPCELILKDVSTVCKDPSRLVEWEKIAMDVVGG